MATRSVEKWKSKRWFSVIAPQLFGEKELATIPANDDKALIGRIIKVNLSWITQKPEHSMLSIGLRIIDTTSNSAKTKVEFLRNSFAYIHSFVKRGTSAIYTRDVLEDKNKNKFVAKFLIVIDKTTKRKKTAIRKLASDYLVNFAKEHSAEEFLNAVINNTIQNEGTKLINPIAKVRRFELNKIEF